MHRAKFAFVLVVSSLAFVAQAPAAPVDLSGQWRFSMDTTDTGVKDTWFDHSLTDHINLPGILQAQGFGDDISVDTPWVAALPRDMAWYKLPQYAPYTKPGNVKMPYLSQPPKHYLGVAWYQRDLDIPADWAGKAVHLVLERPHWETTVWIDDNKIGTNNSLVAPHEFESAPLTPGKHVLSIRIDNRMSVFPNYRPDGHGVSDALGAAWNGIAGKIEMSATSPVFIEDAQVFPDVAKKSASIKIHISNIDGKAGGGTISVASVSTPVTWTADGGDVQVDVPLGDGAQLWDEFHPVLQHLTIQLKGDDADDSHDVSFGLREVSHEGSKLLLNGHEINLRMTHNGGDFPLTGYPATDVDSWKKIIQTCKDFGLNGMRCHSWCPPDAAFQAADELGFYIQPECGMWNDFSKPGMLDMLQKETTRMEHAYGNHPSYLLLSPSNEPAGNSSMASLCLWAAQWLKDDPRRLYSGGTGRSSNNPGPTYTSAAVRGPTGWFGLDYSRGLRNSTIPALGHEVGQWCAYPDFDVIKKFTGYLQPGNYEIWRDFAAEHGVLAENKQLAHASGEFQVQCYKQEIEANLRTKGLSGIQLLDLHDYLGQGGALIGVLDTFWQPKGYVTAEEFHRFCAPVVVLARMRNYVYRTSDTFSIPVEIANYSEGPITGAAPYWKIVDLSGNVAAQGTLDGRDIPIGKGISLGTITTDISKLTAPREYKLVVGLTGPTPTIENDWNFWLYSDQIDASAPANILVTNDWKDAQATLAKGGNVLFTPPAAMLDATCPPLANRPIFWNRVMNNTGRGLSPTGFLGLLVDAKSPALAEFPTQDFCDWQWTDLVSGKVNGINVEDAPPQLQPTVQVIDDWNRGYKLGLIFECKVGAGKLLVSAINLQGDLQSSVAKQLRRSLLDYAAGDKFNPDVTLTADQANALWPSTRPPNYKAPAMPTISNIPGANPGDVVEPTGAAPGPR
ncbi:MAG: sugar-binding domain-containing protein [Tepidisphaeraceae bacterium]